MQDCYFLVDNVLDTPHGGLMVKKNNNASTVVENMLGHYDDFSYRNFYNVNRVGVLPKNATKFVLSFLHMPSEHTPLLSSNTVQLINQDPNVYLVLISVYEYVIEPKKLTLAIKRLGIETKKCIVLSSNVEAHNTVQEEIHYYTINFWESQSRFHLKLLPNAGFVTADERQDSFRTARKKYICLNRNIKPHRIWFYYSIIKNEMLDEGHVSYHLPKLRPTDYKMLSDSEHVTNFIPTELHKDFKLVNARNMYARKLDELNTDAVINYNNTTKGLYLDSILSFVTESESEKNFLTEKTYKAIMNMHPFFIVGNPDQHAFLKQRGYETFEDLFEIDAITNYREASLCLQKLRAKNFSVLKREVQEKYFDKLLHNQQHFLTRKISWNTIVEQLINHTNRNNRA